VPTSIHARRVSHMNVVVEDFDASVKHMEDLFGAVFLLDLPGPNWHACLIEIGGVILELFASPHFMLHSRIGPHYLGVEYEADMTEARAAVTEHGVGIMRDIDVAFHTHPADGFGVDYEFYGGSFFENEPPRLTTLCRPAAYWRDEHPLGLLGLKGYTHAVADLEAASTFLQSFLAATPLYEEERPHLGAQVISLKISDDIVDLLSPTAEGALRREMYRTGEGILSTVFRVADRDRARRYFEERNVQLVAGTHPSNFAVAPAANRGIRFEFSE